MGVRIMHGKSLFALVALNGLFFASLAAFFAALGAK